MAAEKYKPADAAEKNYGMDIIPRRSSLFRRYFGLSVGTVMLATVLLFVMFTLFLMNYWMEDKIDQQMVNSKKIVREAVGMIRATETEEDRRTASLLAANMLNVVSASTHSDYFITDAQGNIIICKDLMDENFNIADRASCSIHEGYKVPKSILQQTTASGFHRIMVLPGLYEGRQIVTGVKMLSSGEDYGYLYAASPLKDGMKPYLQQMAKLFFGAAFVAFVITYILAYIFAARLTRPLQEMSHVTKMYAKGDFSERLRVSGNDELEELAESMNSMAEALSVLEDSRKSFVANVSHELKTPMTTISGFVDGILDGTIPPSQEKRYLKVVSKEVKRLSRLVVTMLTLSKIEVGEEKLRYSVTDMNQLLFNALLSFESSVDEAGFRIEGFDTLPAVKVPADEEMIFQVCYNLFDNAVKFTEPGGIIRVGMTADRNRVTVRISNTGQGIPAGEINRIFERFYKLDKSRSEHVKGVGLGLSLARNIVGLHHGEISVRSEENGFTTFSFWIPTNPGNMLQE